MNFKYLFLFVLFSSSIISLKGQDFTQLVQLAWQNNEQLKAKNFQLQSANFALSEAKSMYGPNIVFGTQYTLAAGGRTIDFPVGDLLNPVYGTLNQLTNSSVFPTIDNVSTQFFPNNFYDARVRISQPIYYPDLAINKQLKVEAIQVKSLEIKAFKRQLSRDVMVAYIQYASAQKGIKIFDSTDSILLEAKRATQSMIKNGVALPSALARIENQISTIAAQKIEAISNKNNAEKYLNFTLGVKNDDVNITSLELTNLPSSDIQNGIVREEIAQLNQSQTMQNLAIKKEEQFYLPRLGTQIDLGSQAFDFGFEPYILFGLNLELNLFDSKRHKHKMSVLKSENMALDAQKNYLSSQFDLKVSIAQENLESALKQSDTYLVRIDATSKIYNEVFKKYKEGTSNYLELIDAQTQLTQINIQYLIAQNNAWLKWADLVYATASFPID